MRKTNLNFVVDAVAFVAFVFLTSTGVLVRYVLPPGSGYSSMLWGMNRHGWGQLHFWIAVVFIACLGLHLFLHWPWVVCMIKGRSREGAGLRVALAVVGVMALAGLATAPFFGRVEQTGGLRHKTRLTKPAESVLWEIKGSMTLNEVQQLTGVPPAVILRELGLPPDLRVDSRLGRLRKVYGFTLQEVREAVRRYREEQ